MKNIQREVKEVIIEYRRGLGNLLKEKLYGLYLYNSVAMGKFEPKYSDIDFVAVIKDHLSEDEIDKLKALHQLMGKNFDHGSRLDGMFIHYADVGKLDDEIEPYIYVHDMICEKGHFDLNNITWWSMREFDVAIDSPSIRGQLTHISWNSILDTMEYNLNTYWAPKLESPDIFADDMWVEFSVVTLSRMIYTLETDSIVSKGEACQYILSRFEEWRDVVQEALAIRALEPRRVIGNISIRSDRTLGFVEFMVNHGNMLMQEKQQKS